MRGDEFDTSRCAVHGASGSPCPELRDAQFLLKVLEGDYRFLYATSVDDIIVLPESPYDSLTLQAKNSMITRVMVSVENTLESASSSPPVTKHISRMLP